MARTVTATIDPPAAEPARVWTAQDLRELPVTINLATSYEILGISRSTAYELYRGGQYPVPVLKLRGCLRVITADLCKLLGVQA